MGKPNFSRKMHVLLNFWACSVNPCKHCWKEMWWTQASIENLIVWLTALQLYALKCISRLLLSFVSACSSGLYLHRPRANEWKLRKLNYCQLQAKNSYNTRLKLLLCSRIVIKRAFLMLKYRDLLMTFWSVVIIINYREALSAISTALYYNQ